MERLITIGRTEAVWDEVAKRLTGNLLTMGNKKAESKSDVKAFDPGDWNNGVGTDRNRNLEIMIILTLHQFPNWYRLW